MILKVSRKPGAFRSHRIKTQGNIKLNSSVDNSPYNQIAMERNYDSISDGQIKAQHEYLKFCLRKINNDIDRMMRQKIQKATRKSSTSFGKNNFPTTQTDIQHEIIQNEKQINVLTYELRKLQIRRKEIEEPEMRVGLDSQLESLKEFIKQCDIQIKNIKRQNIIREKNIVGQYNRVNQCKEERQLQLQIVNQIKKKEGIKTRLEEIERATILTGNEHGMDLRIDDLFKMVEETNRKKEVQDAAFHLNIVYRTKLTTLENISKRRDQHEQSHKAQYYHRLRALQEKTDRLYNYDEEIGRIEMDIMQSRNQIERLENNLRTTIHTPQEGFMLTEIDSRIGGIRTVDTKSSRVPTENRGVWRQDRVQEAQSDDETIGGQKYKEIEEQVEQSIDAYLQQQFDQA